MKRITIWVDCEDAEIESVKRKLEAYLRQEKMEFTVLLESDVSYGSKKTK